MPKEKLRLTTTPLEWNSDRQEVMRLEIQHEYPWSEKEFLHEVSVAPSWKNIIVRGPGEELLGYIITKGDRSQRYILNMMVEQEWRRKGVGARLIRTAIIIARKSRIKSLCVELRETNLDAQLFFRTLGFACVKTVKGYYEDIGEDCYVLKRSIV